MSVYVAIVRALSEKLVVTDLTDRGFAAFSPIMRRWTNPATGPRVKAEMPLIPRHVFVATDDIERDFEAIRHGRRVSGVLGWAGEPRPLPDAGAKWVAQLAITQAVGGFDFTARPKPKLSINQQVRILAGDFQGYTGKLVKLSPAKVTVYVDGRFVKGNINLKPEQVGDAEEAEADGDKEGEPGRIAA